MPQSLTDLDPHDQRFADPFAFASASRDQDAPLLVRSALAAGRARLAFQPVVLARDQSTIAFYEGLVRVLDEGGRVISAAHFMPVIADTDLGRQIDRTLASFIRGQGTVCLVLGAYYAIALMLAGLNFGLIVGFIAGLISFIPYVGAMVGGVLAIGLALFQWWGGTEVVDGQTVEVATNWLRIGIVGAIFMLGQFFEGNILTPNLVGQSVGLHPVWLILALSIFGSLFGFVGMLVAVPVAAVIGVVARFLIAEYKAGQLYKGHIGKDS